MTAASDADRRRHLLEGLLSRDISVERATELLSREPWDWPSALVTVSKVHIEAELLRFICAEVRASDVENWADAFELRDDVDYQSEDVKAIVFELANGELEGSLTVETAREMLQRLSLG